MRLAIVVTVLAALVVAAGVQPSDAANVVRRALNADRVDGLSASRTPRPGQLLALGRDGRFPQAAVPRGPRGPIGPAGATGQPGPSEAFISRTRDVVVSTNAPLQVVELRLPAGSYALDFASHPYLTAGASFLDCDLTANGARLQHTAAHLGPDAAATIEASMVISEAAQFDIPTALRVMCSVRSAGAQVHVPEITLRAIRLGSLTQQ